MATPITWRNVNAPSFGESNRLMQSGGQALAGGINSLAGVAKNMQDQVKREYDKGTATNTDAILGQIAGISTLEDLASQKDQFSDAALRQRFGDQADFGAIRAALANRDNQIRSDVAQGIQHTNLLASEAEKPLLKRIDSLRAQGKFTEATELAKNSEGLVNPGAVIEGITKSKRADTVFRREEDKIARDKFGSDAIQTTLNMNENILAKNKQIAGQLGVPTDESGNLVATGNIMIDEANRVKAEQAGWQPQMSKAQLRENLVTDLNSKNLRTSEIVSSLKAYDLQQIEESPITASEKAKEKKILERKFRANANEARVVDMNIERIQKNPNYTQFMQAYTDQDQVADKATNDNTAINLADAGSRFGNLNVGEYSSKSAIAADLRRFRDQGHPEYVISAALRAGTITETDDDGNTVSYLDESKFKNAVKDYGKGSAEGIETKRKVRWFVFEERRANLR